MKERKTVPTNFKVTRKDYEVNPSVVVETLMAYWPELTPDEVVDLAEEYFGDPSPVTYVN